MFQSFQENRVAEFPLVGSVSDKGLEQIEVQFFNSCFRTNLNKVPIKLMLSSQICGLDMSDRVIKRWVRLDPISTSCACQWLHDHN